MLFYSRTIPAFESHLSHRVSDVRGGRSVEEHAGFTVDDGVKEATRPKRG